MSRQKEIALPFKIMSTPAVWQTGGPESWAFGVISGRMDANAEKTTALEVYSWDGHFLPGFPALRRTPNLVAPGSQAGVADADGDGSDELIAVDVEGRLHRFRNNASSGEAGLVADITRALLVWPPTRLPYSARSLLMLTREFIPRTSSRNALDVVDAGSGKSAPGFPVNLQSSPDAHRPIFTRDGHRVFILLESGAVEGFDLTTGQRLPGFPTEQLASTSRDPVHRMTLFEAWNAIVVSSGTATLMRIDLNSGRAVSVMAGSVARITGVDAFGGRLYVTDDAGGRLLRLDSTLKTVGQLQLKLPAESRIRQLAAFPVPNSEKCFLVVLSSTEPDVESRTEALFEQHATPEIRKKVAGLAADEANHRFHTSNLNPAQQKEIDHSVRMMKLSYLQNTLGEERTSQLLGGTTVSGIQVMTDGPQGLEMVVHDTVAGFEPSTGFSATKQVYPAASFASGVLRLVVPLNAERKGDDPLSEFHSAVRTYELPY